MEPHGETPHGHIAVQAKMSSWCWQRNRTLVSSRVSRTRACIRSGRLEERGITHDVVTKAQFLSTYKRKSEPLAPKFKAKLNKLGPEWSEIMNKRTWVSQAPEAFRSALAEWHWCQTWYSTCKYRTQGKPGSFRDTLGFLGRCCILVTSIEPCQQRSTEKMSIALGMSSLLV